MFNEQREHVQSNCLLHTGLDCFATHIILRLESRSNPFSGCSFSISSYDDLCISPALVCRLILRSRLKRNFNSTISVHSSSSTASPIEIMIVGVWPKRHCIVRRRRCFVHGKSLSVKQQRASDEPSVHCACSVYIRWKWDKIKSKQKTRTSIRKIKWNFVNFGTRKSWAKLEIRRRSHVVCGKCFFVGLSVLVEHRQLESNKPISPSFIVVSFPGSSVAPSYQERQQ